MEVQDDRAAAHLAGLILPSVRLRSTLGGTVDLADAGQECTVIYVYPRTGRPGEPLPEGWDAMPGARGCTPQSCAFRDHQDDLGALGARVIGISAQSPEDQAEFAAREHIPYPLLSDAGLTLSGDPLRLPVFEIAGLTLYRRLTLVVERGSIAKVFYPVLLPEGNAADVLDWLRARWGCG